MSLNDVFISAQTAMFRDGVCQKFVVSKCLWWEFLHGEPCFCLDISVYTRSNVYFVDKFCYKMGLNNV